MDEKNKDMIFGIGATVVFHVAVILILVFSFLYYSYPPKDPEEAAEAAKKEEIMFGGEYVMLGNTQQPASGEESKASAAASEQKDEPAAPAEDMEDAGTKGEEPAQLVSSKRESPMKVKETKAKVKTGPTKDQLAAQEKEKRQKEAADKINRRVAFGKSSGNGDGREGSPNGNSSTGARSGSPGVSGLPTGYSVASWGRPHSPAEGTLRIMVKVNSRGKVISARYVSGSGPASSITAVRSSCVSAALQSQFRVPLNTITVAVGYITWRFE